MNKELEQAIAEIESNKEKELIKGYKVFNPDWTCRGFQFEVGEIFEDDFHPHVCYRGFHFCKDLKDCFNYYGFNASYKVAQVVALGAVDYSSEDSKCCTNKIGILHELSWGEVLSLVNTGEANTGKCNAGNHNTGDGNTGNHNTGRDNLGNSNTGVQNKGDHNTGYGNFGDGNTGDNNTGNHNTGNNNSGDGNTGHFNKCNHSTGCFNTQEQTIYLFNKPSSWTYDDWEKSEAAMILGTFSPDVYTYPQWWDQLNSVDQAQILNLPNFDPEIFKEITGIDVTETNNNSNEKGE